MNDNEKKIIIKFRDEGKPNVTFNGEGIRYKVEDGMLRAFKGNYTKAWPLDVIFEVETTL